MSPRTASTLLITAESIGLATSSPRAALDTTSPRVTLALTPSRTSARARFAPASLRLTTVPLSARLITTVPLSARLLATVGNTSPRPDKELTPVTTVGLGELESLPFFSSPGLKSTPTIGLRSAAADLRSLPIVLKSPPDLASPMTFGSLVTPLSSPAVKLPTDDFTEPCTAPCSALIPAGLEIDSTVTPTRPLSTTEPIAVGLSVTTASLSTLRDASPMFLLSDHSSGLRRSSIVWIDPCGASRSAILVSSFC